jgi:hypothetical protein
MNPKALSSAEQRTLAILDSYGSRPEAWPAEERRITLACIQASPLLQQYQRQLAELDARIETEQEAAIRQLTPNLSALQRRILSQLPEQTTPTTVQARTFWQRSRDWLLPRQLMPALVATMLVTVVFLTSQIPPSNPPAADADEYEAWAWYDITGQELPIVAANSSLTMTDLVDLEIRDGG